MASKHLPGRFRAGLAGALVLAAFAGGLASGHLGLAGAQGGSGDPVFVALPAPVRYLDTRPAPYGPIGVTASGPVRSSAAIDVAVAGASINGTAHVPLTARSVLVNITAVNATVDTFVTAHSSDSGQPNASTLNPSPGRTTFNTATVAMGPSHRMRLYNDAGQVDLIVDVVGYFVDHDHDDRYYTEIEIDARVPRGQTITVSGAAFSPSSETAAFNRDLGGCYYPDDTQQAHAGLFVPVGSMIERLIGRFRDSDVGAVMNLVVYVQHADGSLEQVTAVTSQTNDGSFEVFDLDLPTPYLVRAADSLLLIANLSDISSSIGVCSATVDYTRPG